MGFKVTTKVAVVLVILVEVVEVLILHHTM